MTVPSTDFSQIDNALGVTNSDVGFSFAVVGPCSTGATGFGGSFSRGQDLVAAYGKGPGVELGSYIIAKTGKPILFAASGVTTPGSTTLSATAGFHGTATVSATGAAYDEYEALVYFVTGGTAGNTGITYQDSLDNGRTFSSVKALGTGGSLTIADGNVTFSFTAGTVVAGDIVKATTVAPKEASGDFTAVLNSLGASSLPWDVLALATPLDANAVSAVDTFMQSKWDAGDPKAFLASPRGATAGESEQAYQTNLSSEFGSSHSLYGTFCAGYSKIQSAVTSRAYRRPAVYSVAARAGSSIISSPSISLAEVDLGPLSTDVQIRDSNGKADEHDERENPGLDALRFCCLRTFPRRTGVYINRPLVFAPAGSDYWRFDYRMVINKFRSVLQDYFDLQLEKALRVNKTTGFILELEAQRLELGATNAARDALMTKPDASGVIVVVGRTDNILSTRLLHVSARIVPLAYPDTIGVSIGFLNPANNLVAV